MAKVGRPNFISKKWNDTIKEVILNDYKEGRSDICVINKLDICSKTFYNWKGKSCNNEDLNEQEKDFVQTIEKGNRLSQEWWEELGLKGVKGETKFNLGAFIFQMKNRFKRGGYDGSWSDRQDLNHSASEQDKVNVNIDLNNTKVKK